MQTHMTKRKTPDRAVPPVQEAAPSRSEMLHLSGAGAPQPMSPQLREKFEPGFGADFSNIRISRGHIPEEMGVQAVAQGTDILLDERAGMDVLGHELAHVVQQAQGRVAGGFPVVENAALEHEADVMGQRVSSGLTAQAGPQNGFGGELMSIAPMSEASAPAQCKSKEKKQQKKDAKTMQKITDAEQRRDVAIAGGANSRDARRAFGEEMEQIVNGMSQRQLQSQAFQDRMVSMAAGPVNSGLRQVAAGDDGSKTASDYSLLIRGAEYEPEMKGMNMMAQRLLGRQEMADIAKSGTSVEQRMGSAADLLGANPGAMHMLNSFKRQAFAGVDHGVMSDDAVQSNLMTNNFLNRIFGSAGAKLKELDKAATSGAIEMQRHARTDLKTGQYVQSSPEVDRLTALFADPNARAAAPQSAPVQVEEDNSLEEMMGRVAQGELNRSIPREQFDSVTDDGGNVDTAKVAAAANAASPSYAGMRDMFNEDRAAREAAIPSYQGMREMFNESRAASEIQMPGYEGVKRIFTEPKTPAQDAETTFEDMQCFFNPAIGPRREAQAAYRDVEKQTFSGSMQSIFDEDAAELEELMPRAPGASGGDDIYSGLGIHDDLEDEEAKDMLSGAGNVSGAPPQAFLDPSYMRLLDSGPMGPIIGDEDVDMSVTSPPKKKSWWKFWK